MSTRVTSSHFVGRAGELAECEAALREAGGGAPSVIALSGDSGVGKTRLIAEFSAAAGGRARFLRGECVEIGEGELPYGPLIGALRELARCGDPALENLSSGARESLGALLPGLTGSTGPVEPSDESAQLRLFEATLELLDLLGEEQPVVLVIEDLHWADRSTRAFTAFLARSLRSERVLFLFSYRSDELHRRHPLLALLSELDHGERTRRVALHPWGRDELGEALGDILGAPAEAELVERLFARAEGNPLYTEELLAAGLDGRGGAPRSLRDAFMLRLERLSDDAQRVLRVLAAAGRADESLLAAVSGLDGPELTTALREAVESHVIEAGSDACFTFRHALLREVAYEDLLPGERASLHLEIAHALDDSLSHDGHDDAQVVARVAAHAQAAGDRTLLLTASVAAAAAASSIHAHGEAADLLERALEAWPHVEGPQTVTGIDHAELLARAASEHDDDDKPTRAEPMFAAALAEIDEDAEPVRSAQLLDRLARTRWSLARGDEALATARRALELLPPGRADAQRASVLVWLARTTLLRGRYRDAAESAREALEIVTASDAGKHLESQVLETLGMALVGSGSPEDGIDTLRRALALARESGLGYTLAYAYGNLAEVLFVTGQTRAALELALEGAGEIPSHLRGSRAWLGAMVAEVAFAYGQWQLAARNLAVGDLPFEGRWLMNLRLRQAELALGPGRLDEADRALAEIEHLVSRTLEPQFHGHFGLASADLRRRRGDLDGARAALQQALDRIELCTEDAIRLTAIAAAGVAIEADIAQRARDQGDGDCEAGARRRAEIGLERTRAAAEAAGAVEAIWLRTAEAEHGRATGADDPAAWASAAAGWEELDRPYPAARIRLRQAEAELERGDRDAAAVSLACSIAGAERLGADWLVEEGTALAARARLVLASPEAVGAAGADVPAAQPADPFGLTPRELEVLRLVARGATNREIGAELFMAEKTASVHVSRILAKLDVRTRTQAAAVAYRAGLATDGRASDRGQVQAAR
ncbi:MAG TPA: AAA family ATPase [Solirubrobacteraceae bacterium]|nr:AAA family ATPase [Solirubrobacteraceae bacterium]